MNENEIKKQYNKIAKDYIAGQQNYFSNRDNWHREATNKYLSNIGGKKILDIGCGGGIDFKNFEERGAEAYGIDPSP